MIVYRPVDKLAKKAASKLKQASEVTVVSHIVADGISAAGIASQALDHIDMEHEVKFAKKLDETFVNELIASKPELVWFTDLGSGSTDILQDLNCVISDHHKPVEPAGSITKKKPKTLFDFDESKDMPVSNYLQVNPHFVGRDGSNDISGAGTAYLVARALDPELRRLSHLAIVGAVGDMQDREMGRLQGTNRDILADAEHFGVIEAIEDVKFFGRETRPIWKMLQYASELQINGITDDYRGSMNFFMELGINLFLAGHYATETFGVKALGARLAQEFSLEWSFLDLPTGM